MIAYPGVNLSALHGLCDIIERANELGQIVGARQLLAEQLSSADVAERPFELFEAIVLPPSAVNSDPQPQAALFDWLRAQHQGGAVLCSVCVGAFVLGRAGLLDGRTATTHWALKDRLSELCPRARIETDRLLIDEGDIVTAGGLLAWVDLGLCLVTRFLSPSIMLDVARHFLADPRGREQRFYSVFVPRMDHGDAAVLKTQHWLASAYAERIDVAEMARRAGLTGRTFLRRFQRSTGLNPNAYLQQLRIAKARESLETSRETFSRISWHVGYEDPAAFAKLFQRAIGLSPGEYRRRFGIVAATA